MKSRVADSLTRRAIEQYSRAVLYHFCLAAIAAIVVGVGYDTSSVGLSSSPLSLSHLSLTSQPCCPESPVEHWPSHLPSAMF